MENDCVKEASRAAMTALAIVLACSTVAKADDGTRQAYDAALKCFVVSGIASGDFKDLGKSDKASALDSKAHASFDLAVKFGRELGYSNRRINGDLDSVKANELPRMMRDDAYYKAAVGTCKALGLM